MREENRWHVIRNSGSPERPSRGVSARSPAGGTSSRPSGCSPRCARSVSRPPRSAPTASCPRTRRSSPTPSPSTTCTPSAGSSRWCCTCPGTTRHPPSTGCSTGSSRAGATTLVLSADSGLTGYDSRPELDDEGWATLLGNLDRLAALAADRGIAAVLHPHVGTMVENPDDVQKVLDGSGIALCLDTGHLLIGGTDPAELTRQVPERIAHTHMKDVDNRFARRVQGGELTYTEAVREGMYRPLGSGDVDVAAIVGYLEGHGYDGWYVLEQDTILPGDPSGEGPVTRRADQRGVPAGAVREGGALSGAAPHRRARRRPDHRALADRTRADHRRPARGGRRPRPVARRGLRGAARRRAGRSTRTPRCWTTPRSRSSTTRSRTRCTGRGTSRPCEAGKHVLTEKPSASNAEEAREVRDVADERRRDGDGGLPLPVPPPARAGCSSWSRPGSWARCARSRSTW